MSLAPQLKIIKVDPNKLYLDPNNPRLFEKETEKVPLDKVTEPGVQSSTENGMGRLGGGRPAGPLVLRWL